MAASFSKHKKDSRAKDPDAKLIESLVYGLKHTVEAEVISREKMVKLIEAEIFNLRRVQKDQVDTVAALDVRIAKMIDFLNTFPDRVGRAVTAAMTGRGWGDPIPVDPEAKGLAFFTGGKIEVGGKLEQDRTKPGAVSPGRFMSAGSPQVQIKGAKPRKEQRIIERP